MQLALIGLILVAGCAHQENEPAPLVLNKHEPYGGVPRYLRCPAPPVAEQPPCPCAGTLTAARATGADVSVRGGVQPDQPSLTKMERMDKLRTVLAAIDAHVAALGEHPAPEQIEFLKASVAELRKLLDAWPDVLPEAEEMAQLIDKIETTLPIERPLLRKRLNQLADLIRVQVVLGD